MLHWNVQYMLHLLSHGMNFLIIPKFSDSLKFSLFTIRFSPTTPRINLAQGALSQLSSGK